MAAERNKMTPLAAGNAHNMAAGVGTSATAGHTPPDARAVTSVITPSARRLRGGVARVFLNREESDDRVKLSFCCCSGAQMKSSTPQSAGRSLSTASSFDSVFVSPSTRPQALSAGSTPELESLAGNDDEQEKKQRRRSRILDLKLSSTESPLVVKSPAIRQADTSLPVIPRLTNAQISDHYSTCFKLSAENKITTKNAFGLHLIDYMTEILKQKDSELTNFKMAAGTLDASTKIYAVRVDAVHADVYKVLGGLGKDSQSTREEDGQDLDGTATLEARKKAPTKDKHFYKTIEQNPNNLNVPETDCKCEVDPMLQKSAASFDECSTVGIFLSTLHIHSYCSELLFESKVTPLSSSEMMLESPSSAPVKVADINSLLLKCIENRPICPSLTSLRFNEWDSESHNESVSALLEKFKKSDQVFNVNADVEDEPEDCADAPVMDDFDVDLLDKTMAGDLGKFAQDPEAFRMAHEGTKKDVIPLGEGDITTMCLQLSTKPGEYSYFSPQIMSMWAGPEHWRFKPRHKLEAGADKEIRKKSAKKVFEINFDEDVNFEPYFRETRAATTMAKSVLESQNKKSTTLPADFHYDPNSLTRLFLKPDVKLWRMSMQSSSSNHSDEIGEYDYNNPNDTSNFCPASQCANSDDDDDNDPADFGGQTGDFELTANTARGFSQGVDANRADITTYGESNLVAEPKKVNKIEIQYAKTAKKMDMKKLKQTMWDLLTEAKQKQVPAENKDVEEEAAAVVMGEKVLSNLTKELPCRLPSVMAQNLSIPLAFSCLLHLANEKNLRLQGVEDLSDVLIQQGQ
ncbi:condensin complex subunit 2 isoform X2 [Alligator mississippiensis]|uniref:condensin complex subunit 2 isoform X2 n=1 Tax=Alligator mississippiensis TaxID=8496 RepID=UPI0009071685|nr:condensin complex subunit 2 isoform X2 [Alligator mississippiensis]